MTWPMTALGASLKCHPPRRTIAYGEMALHVLAYNTKLGGLTD